MRLGNCYIYNENHPNIAAELAKNQSNIRDGHENDIQLAGFDKAKFLATLEDTCSNFNATIPVQENRSLCATSSLAREALRRTVRDYIGLEDSKSLITINRPDFLQGYLPHAY